jgi:hypothetical protein
MDMENMALEVQILQQLRSIETELRNLGKALDKISKQLEQRTYEIK